MSSVTQGSKNGTKMFFLKWALAKMAEIDILRSLTMSETK
jgi:hypothetical protein